ncbi:MAG TPA: ABC transporter ATP-binding protein [Chloroflexota bacterium]|nr:ABC transporter ATP-binding protein [Chloroflexota bacterium]
MPILEVENLTKRYGAFCAVDGISFQLERGKVLGLLGPNGAGKTTTIHMLVGATLPDGGSIRYVGQELSKHKKECLQRINFASSFNTLQTRISVWENLLVFAYLYSVRQPEKRVRQLAADFGIEHLLAQRFQTLSAGQKTRVNLVKSLINDPEIVLMDEPTASLDPDVADRTMTLLEELKASRQLSLVYTSHEMDEVARICDEVIFLDKGRIVAHGTPGELIRRIATSEVRMTFSGDEEAVKRALRAAFPDATVERYHAVIATQEERVAEAIVAVNSSGATITDVDIRKATLEDVFLRIARGEQRIGAPVELVEAG